MATFLQLSAITKRFSKVEALHDVSLDVGVDELVVVLGPTGAGKTTLLRTIAGLERPDSGCVHMAGDDVTAFDPARRDVALVFQNFSIYPDKTVRQNLEFPLRAPGRNLSRDEITQRVTWAAEMLRITPLLDRRSDRLSGGQMQRVAIGRAIVRRPRLFLMDEPLTNLDAKLREALRVELAVLRRELKTPMVYVTHDQAEAMSMADRIVVLSGGRVLQQGSPSEVYNRPVSPEVARLLGQPMINLLDAKRTSLPGIDRIAGTIGIRPEHVRIDPTAKPNARVVLVENAGPTLLVVVDWLGHHVRALAPRSLAVLAGDSVSVSVDPQHVQFWSEAACAPRQ
jgi:multiple sugar transport system ATP-binding protein